jgi:hypothetical protein
MGNYLYYIGKVGFIVKHRKNIKNIILLIK